MDKNCEGDMKEISRKKKGNMKEDEANIKGHEANIKEHKGNEKGNEGNRPKNKCFSSTSLNNPKIE